MESNVDESKPYKKRLTVYRKYKLIGESGIEHSFDYFIYSDRKVIAADFSDGDVEKDMLKLILKSHDTGVKGRILIVDDDNYIDQNTLEIARENSVKIMKYSEFVEAFDIK